MALTSLCLHALHTLPSHDSNASLASSGVSSCGQWPDCSPTRSASGYSCRMRSAYSSSSSSSSGSHSSSSGRGGIGGGACAGLKAIPASQHHGKSLFSLIDRQPKQLACGSSTAPMSKAIQSRPHIYRRNMYVCKATTTHPCGSDPRVQVSPQQQQRQLCALHALQQLIHTE